MIPTSAAAEASQLPSVQLLPHLPPWVAANAAPILLPAQDLTPAPLKPHANLVRGSLGAAGSLQGRPCRLLRKWQPTPWAAGQGLLLLGPETAVERIAGSSSRLQEAQLPVTAVALRQPVGSACAPQNLRSEGFAFDLAAHLPATAAPWPLPDS